MVGDPRNFGATPLLDREGYFLKPMNVPANLPKSPMWHKGLSCFDRLNYHQTLASARRFAYYRTVKDLIPGDALDVALGADYDHGYVKFPDEIDVILQPTTTGADKRRRLRNIIELPKAFDAIGTAVEAAEAEEAKKVRIDDRFDFDTAGHYNSPMEKWRYVRQHYGRYDKHHPLYVTGIKERYNPHYVKLMNSSHHSPQTNAGYSRQDSDGNAYQY